MESNRTLLKTQFVRRAEALGAEVHDAYVEDLTALISRLTKGRGAVGVSAQATSEYPALAGLGKASSEWSPVAVSCAPFGVASCGCLALAETTHRDRLTSLLTYRHVVLLEQDALVPSLGDAAALLRECVRLGRRYVTFVGGPSRTSDIERVLTLGVHGPCELIVVLVDRNQTGGA